MNRVEIIGRLTRDPELKFVGDKRFPIASLNMAVDDGVGRWNPESKKREVDSGFYQVEFHGKYAETVAAEASKGDEVWVIGHLSQWRKKGRDGEESETKTRILGRAAQVLSAKRGAGIQPPAEPIADDDPWSSGWAEGEQH